jgi:hypothetical protein
MHDWHPARPHSIAAATLCVLTALAGCSTVEVRSFENTGSTNVDSAYVATDADFSKYSRLLVDDMGIFFPSSVALTDEELSRIRQIFRDSFSARLAGYEFTREPGPGMLQVSATLIDLRESTYADIPNMRRELRGAARPGSLLFLMELKDSGTGETLARAGDSQSAPRFAAGDTDWTAVEAAAQHWAALFRNFLDQNLGN